MTDQKCARCLAGLCDHQGCATPGFGLPAETDVAGTSCCGDCAPVLLELVLHPLTTVVVNPPVKAGQFRDELNAAIRGQSFPSRSV